LIVLVSSFFYSFGQHSTQFSHPSTVTRKSYQGKETIKGQKHCANKKEENSMKKLGFNVKDTRTRDLLLPDFS